MNHTIKRAEAAALVNIDREELWTDSLKIAERFGKRHKNVLQAIDRLECSAVFNRLNFQPVDYIDAKGETRRMIRMTRDGFMFLVMGFTGKPAAAVKEYFIAAFNAMEKELRNQKVDTRNAECLEARAKGKLTRRELTDEIQDFVKYAMGQGSTQAERYYKNVTSMVYKALGMVDQVEPIRDTLDTIGNVHLAAAESVAKRAIADGVEQGLHYKAVYTLAKERVLQYAALIGAQTLGGGTGRSVVRPSPDPARRN